MTAPAIRPSTFVLALCMLALPLLAQPASVAGDDIAQRAERVRSLGDQWPRPDDLPHAVAMQREYATNFGQIDDAPQLRKETDADLALHWQALGNAAFYSDDQGLAAAAVRVHAELERRGLTDTKSAHRLFNVLLQARRFDAAREFAARHPGAGLPAIPRFIDADTDGLPSAWRFSDDGSARRIGIDLGPLQIIVAAGCHFSADAARDIADDPVLGPVFARHAHWLSLPPGSEHLDALAEWRRAHPRTPMLAIHARGEWALIPRWDMPTFAVVKDGKLIDSTKGWDSNDPEFRERLLALLERTGLLKAGTH